MAAIRTVLSMKLILRRILIRPILTLKKIRILQQIVIPII